MIIGLPHEDVLDPSSCERGGGEGRWVTKNPSFYLSLAEGVLYWTRWDGGWVYVGFPMTHPALTVWTVYCVCVGWGEGLGGSHRVSCSGYSGARSPSSAGSQRLLHCGLGCLPAAPCVENTKGERVQKKIDVWWRASPDVIACSCWCLLAMAAIPFHLLFLHADCITACQT